MARGLVHTRHSLLGMHITVWWMTYLGSKIAIGCRELTSLIALLAGIASRVESPLDCRLPLDLILVVRRFAECNRKVQLGTCTAAPP